MQSIAKLRQLLERLADDERYLFAVPDLAPAFPELGYGALKALLVRATRSGLLTRVCNGIYLYPLVRRPRGLELYHTAARLRADSFTYLSLESALSEAGVISQMPLSRITLMTSGRSHTFACGAFGTIEFIHTRKRPDAVAAELSYDDRCRLWRASVRLALADLRDTRRSLDLVDPEVARDHVR